MAKGKSNSVTGSGGVQIGNRQASTPRGSSTRGGRPAAAVANPAGSSGPYVRGQSRTVSGNTGATGSKSGSGRTIKG